MRLNLFFFFSIVKLTNVLYQQLLHQYSHILPVPQAFFRQGKPPYNIGRCPDCAKGQCPHGTKCLSARLVRSVVLDSANFRCPVFRTFPAPNPRITLTSRVFCQYHIQAKLLRDPTFAKASFTLLTRSFVSVSKALQAQREPTSTNVSMNHTYCVRRRYHRHREHRSQATISARVLLVVLAPSLQQDRVVRPTP